MILHPQPLLRSQMMLLGCGSSGGGAAGLAQITEVDFGSLAAIGSDFATGGEGYYLLISNASGVVCFWFYTGGETVPTVDADAYRSVTFGLSDAPGDMAATFGVRAALEGFTDITPPSSGGLCVIEDNATGVRAEPVTGPGCPVTWSVTQFGT